jgi:hypothetical protein
METEELNIISLMKAPVKRHLKNGINFSCR